MHSWWHHTVLAVATAGSSYLLSTVRGITNYKCNLSLAFLNVALWPSWSQKEQWREKDEENWTEKALLTILSKMKSIWQVCMLWWQKFVTKCEDSVKQQLSMKKFWWSSRVNSRTKTDTIKFLGISTESQHTCSKSHKWHSFHVCHQSTNVKVWMQEHALVAVCCSNTALNS